MAFRELGTFVCPSDDGDYRVTVEDHTGWYTGACIVKQVGQGEEHNIVLSKDEAAKLAVILAKFAAS